MSVLKHVHWGYLAVNLGDFLTRCEVHVITDNAYKLATQCVSIVVVRPWGVHELQRVRDDISGLFPWKRKQKLKQIIYLIFNYCYKIHHTTEPWIFSSFFACRLPFS